MKSPGKRVHPNMPARQTLRHHTAGFTLIELMIAVAIAGIVLSIAVPSYTEYVQRSHRANAKTALLQAAHWMERAATTTGSYPLTESIPAGLLQVEGGRYSVTAISTGVAFTFTASRVASTGQAGDKCGDYVLDQANRKTVINATRMTAQECWAR